MAASWLQCTILRLASLIAPAAERGEWLAAWRSELWYIAPGQATRFCAGAFRDAWSLRRDARLDVARLDSPLACLAILTSLAIASVAIIEGLPLHGYGRLWASHIAEGCLAMLFFSTMLLPAIWVSVGRASHEGGSDRWLARVRRAVFLGLKIALVQPLMLCGFVALIFVGPVVPFLPQLAMLAFWTLTLRWTLTDQRDRCPVCLRLLKHPVRIGTASGTFLEWYGAESICVRGHGLLQVPGISASYAGTEQWLRLDSSWKPLFDEAAARR